MSEIRTADQFKCTFSLLSTSSFKNYDQFVDFFPCRLHFWFPLPEQQQFIDTTTTTTYWRPTSSRNGTTFEVYIQASDSQCELDGRNIQLLLDKPFILGEDSGELMVGNFFMAAGKDISGCIFQLDHVVVLKQWLVFGHWTKR